MLRAPRPQGSLLATIIGRVASTKLLASSRDGRKQTAVVSGQPVPKPTIGARFALPFRGLAAAIARIFVTAADDRLTTSTGTREAYIRTGEISAKRMSRPGSFVSSSRGVRAAAMMSARGVFRHCFSKHQLWGSLTDVRPWRLDSRQLHLPQLLS